MSDGPLPYQHFGPPPAPDEPGPPSGRPNPVGGGLGETVSDGQAAFDGTAVPATEPSATPPDRELFANPVLDPDALPALNPEEFESLDPRYLWLGLVGSAVGAGVVATIAGVATVALVVADQDDVPVWLPAAVGGALLAIIGLATLLQVLEIRHLGYLIREHDLSFRRGVIGRTVTTVPYARVQNVTIERGPLARWKGLASLEVRTAAGGFSGITIPGLDHETAQRLRGLVADRSAVLAEQEARSDSEDPVQGR